MGSLLEEMHKMRLKEKIDELESKIDKYYRANIFSYRISYGSN